jgi:mycofactocin system glycosyltransferase
MATSPLVAFLDADCVPARDFPGELLDHLADPAVGVAAPRIVATAQQARRIAAYERSRSALDMGPRPALVRPYAFVWYVPSAAMVARRDALGHGFDDQLELGEDVDLVWRLHDAGWRIRYDPRAAVAHEHRVDPLAWYRRRVAYNESVGPLHRRHPGRVPVMFLSPAAALAWGSALGGSPWSLLVLTIVRAARMRRALAGRVPGTGGWAMRISARETAREGRELGRALAGPWSPFVLGALLMSGNRRHGLGPRLAALIGAGFLSDWLSERPQLDPLTYGALRLAEESARGVGVWIGCLRARDLSPLRPRRPPPPSRR